MKMNNKRITCPQCGEITDLIGNSCLICNSNFPDEWFDIPAFLPMKENNEDQLKQILPFVEVKNLRAWYTACDHVSFELAIDTMLDNIIKIIPEYSGLLYDKDLLFRKDLLAKGNNRYMGHFHGTIPDRGGDCYLEMKFTFVNSFGEEHDYYATLSIYAIDAKANKNKMIEARIRSTIVEINNDQGIVDFDVAKPGSSIKINNTGGAITNVENCLRNGDDILDKIIELTPLVDHESSICDQGRIKYRAGYKTKETLLFAREEIVLGRYCEDNPPDLVLTCFPENIENRFRIQRISRGHCKIRCDKNNFYINDIASRWGTILNDSLLERGLWHLISDQDIIQFADRNNIDNSQTGALRFRAFVSSHALKLERVDNAPEQEDYLLLMPNCLPSIEQPDDQPIFFHYQGRFGYYDLNCEQQILQTNRHIQSQEFEFIFLES